MSLVTVNLTLKAYTNLCFETRCPRTHPKLDIISAYLAINVQFALLPKTRIVVQIAHTDCPNLHTHQIVAKRSQSPRNNVLIPWWEQGINWLPNIEWSGVAIYKGCRWQALWGSGLTPSMMHYFVEWKATQNVEISRSLVLPVEVQAIYWSLHFAALCCPVPWSPNKHRSLHCLCVQPYRSWSSYLLSWAQL